MRRLRGSVVRNAARQWCGLRLLRGRVLHLSKNAGLEPCRRQGGDVYFDSLGVFNEATVRAHCKIHPKVEFRLDLRQDAPDYEEEFNELRAFYKAEIGKAIDTLARSCSVRQAEAAPPLLRVDPLVIKQSRSRKASRP